MTPVRRIVAIVAIALGTAGAVAGVAAGAAHPAPHPVRVTADGPGTYYRS